MAQVRILLVEDSPFQRKYLRLQLEGQGYLVLEAATGEQAEAQMRSAPPDAVLLDWELPDIEGPQLLRRWGGDPQLRWVPVLMVTTHKDSASLIQALDSGAVDFLTKPPDEVELVARLRTALRIKSLQDQLRELSIRDPLTALYNRRHLDERLQAEFSRATRYRHPFSCAMVDVDHFKRINDTHGHEMGDLILQQLAQHLHGGIRDTDILGRYGGEEFLLLLPEAAHDMALACLKRLQAGMKGRPWGTKDKRVQVTFSAGVATLPVPGTGSPEELVKAADQALYRAKEAGRDRVVSAQATGETAGAAPPVA